MTDCDLNFNSIQHDVYTTSHAPSRLAGFDDGRRLKSRNSGRPLTSMRRRRVIRFDTCLRSLFHRVPLNFPPGLLRTTENVSWRTNSKVAASGSHINAGSSRALAITRALGPSSNSPVNLLWTALDHALLTTLEQFDHMEARGILTRRGTCVRRPRLHQLGPAAAADAADVCYGQVLLHKSLSMTPQERCW